MLVMHFVVTSLVDGMSLSDKPSRGRCGCAGAALAQTGLYTHLLLNSGEGRILPVSDTRTQAPDGGGVDQNMNEHSIDDCLINPSNRLTVESGTVGGLGVHWLSKLCLCSMIHGHCGLKYIAG